MSTYEVKVEKKLSREELATFLRKFASGLKGGESLPVGPGVDISGFDAVKLTLKRDGEMTSLKLKVAFKQPPEGSEAAAPEPQKQAAATESYKTIKKRMKKSFAGIKTQVQAGQVPSADDAKAFHEDSRRMMSFPGKGDEYYASYENALKTFVKAIETGRLAEIKKSVAALDLVHQNCHKKYK